MSVKIKINWDNENVVSESVRIYRADSAFTKENLPPVLTEIIGDVYEYEDLTTADGQTYFYMLSAKLGEQEVFTECFEVKAVIDITNAQAFSFNSPFPQYWSTYFNLETGDFNLSRHPINDPVGSTSNDLKVLASTKFIDLSDGTKYYYELIVASEVTSLSTPATEINNMLRIGIAIEGLHTGLNSSSSSGGVYFSAEGYGKCWMRRINSTTYGFRGGDLTTYGNEVTLVVPSAVDFGDVIGVLAYKPTSTKIRIEYYINGVFVKFVEYTIVSTRKLKPLIVYQLQNNSNSRIYMNSPRKMLFKPVGAVAWPIT